MGKKQKRIKKVENAPSKPRDSVMAAYKECVQRYGKLFEKLAE